MCFLFLKPGSSICLMVKPKRIIDSFFKNPQCPGPSLHVKGSPFPSPQTHGGFLVSSAKPALGHYFDEKYCRSRSFINLFPLLAKMSKVQTPNSLISQFPKESKSTLCSPFFSLFLPLLLAQLLFGRDSSSVTFLFISLERPASSAFLAVIEVLFLAYHFC